MHSRLEPPVLETLHFCSVINRKSLWQQPTQGTGPARNGPVPAGGWTRMRDSVQQSLASFQCALGEQIVTIPCSRSRRWHRSARRRQILLIPRRSSTTSDSPDRARESLHYSALTPSQWAPRHESQGPFLSDGPHTIRKRSRDPRLSPKRMQGFVHPVPRLGIS